MQLIPHHIHRHTHTKNTARIVLAEMENVEKDSLKDQAASVGQYGRTDPVLQSNIYFMLYYNNLII